MPPSSCPPRPPLQPPPPQFTGRTPMIRPVISTPRTLRTSANGVYPDPVGMVKSSFPTNKKAPLPFRDTRLATPISFSGALAVAAVAGFLVLFGGGGDAGAAEFVGIILAEQQVPLLAAFENFFFLRGDLLADFDLDFFFLAQDVGHGLDHVLADSVAVFDKFHFVALHQQVHDLVRDAHHFFPAQSPSVLSPLSPCPSEFANGLPQNQFAVPRQLPLHLLEHFLVRNSGAAHLILVLGEDGAHFFVDFIFDGDLFHHPRPHLEDHRFDVFFLDCDLLVFDEFLDQLRGHMAHIIAVQQHLWDVPLKDSKTLSLLGARIFRNRCAGGPLAQNWGKNQKVSRFVDDAGCFL